MITVSNNYLNSDLKITKKVLAAIDHPGIDPEVAKKILGISAHQFGKLLGRTYYFRKNNSLEWYRSSNLVQFMEFLVSKLRSVDATNEWFSTSQSNFGGIPSELILDYKSLLKFRNRLY